MRDDVERLKIMFANITKDFDRKRKSFEIFLCNWNSLWFIIKILVCNKFRNFDFVYKVKSTTYQWHSENLEKKILHPYVRTNKINQCTNKYVRNCHFSWMISNKNYANYYHFSYPFVIVNSLQKTPSIRSNNEY